MQHVGSMFRLKQPPYSVSIELQVLFGEDASALAGFKNERVPSM